MENFGQKILLILGKNIGGTKGEFNFVSNGGEPPFSPIITPL
jgi:hypothetical protein